MSDDATRSANVDLTANVDGYRQSVQGATQDTNQLASSVDALASKLDNLTRRASKRLTLFGAADLAMMTSMVAVTASYQKQMTALSAQSAITGRSMGIMSNNIRQMTRDLPVARGEIVATATAISKMGVTSSRDITGLTQTFLKASAASGEYAISLAQSMTMLSRQMGTLAAGAPQMQKFTDSLLTVSAQAGVSAQSVADFANSIAPIANVAKMSQAQVLGLSTAFVQAGNDGYAAATMFNKMLSDIVQTTSEGGPGLDKYASLLGITVKQFKAMPAADQITGIFKAINAAGPNSIAIVNQMGYDGIRATKAIAAMASQSGGLEKMIQTATGAYGNGATNTGAAEAMGGLTDQMQRFGNLAQDMATSIGSGIIAPLTGSLTVLNNILAQAAKLSGVFAAGGALAALGGAGAMGAGALGTVASYAALPVALRWMWNSKPFGAFRAGRQSGMGNMDATPGGYADRFTNGTAGRLESLAFGGGWRVGEHAPTSSGVTGGLGRALGAPFRIGTAFMGASRQFYNEAGTPGYQRGQEATNLLGMQSGALTKAIKSTDGLAVSMGKAAVAAGRFVAAEGRAGLSAASAAAKPMLGAIGSSALSFLGGPMGLALMGGTALLSLKSALDNQKEQFNARSQTDQFYNQMVPYTTQLGIATTSLQTFTGSLNYAGTAAKTIAEALSRASSSVAAKGTPINANVGSISTAAQGASYLRTLGTSDPKVVQAAAQDVLKQLGPTEGQKALNLYQANQTGSLADIATLAGGVSNPQGNNEGGPWGGFAVRMGVAMGETSDQAAQTTVGAISAYSSQFSTSGDKAQYQAQFNGIRQAINTILQGNGTPRQKKDAIDQITRQFGMPEISHDAIANSTTFDQIASGSWTRKPGLSHFDVGGLGKWVAQSQANQGLDVTSDPATAMRNAIATSSNPETGGLTSLGINVKAGAVTGVLGSSGGHPNDPNAQAQAIQYLYAQARSRAAKQVQAARAANARRMGLPINDPRVIAASGTINDYANQNLANIRGVVTDPSDPAYGPLNTASSSAQSLLGNDLALQGVTQGRVGKLASSRTQFMGAKAAFEDTNNLDPNKYGNYVAAQASYKQQMASYTQYMQEMLRTQEQFQLQMSRSDRDYHLQLQYSQEDFQKGQKRSKEDFNLSMTRQAQDSAKTIYNPFQRVQSVYTADVGTLKQNLAEQLRMIKAQVANLRKLKALGLQQSTIDMLDLANPSNAQQVAELVQEMSKGDAATLNKAASDRLGATKSLTQSDLNQGYTRTVADFQKSIDRGIADYQTGMARMRTAHANQVADARKDLALLSKEYTDDFTTTFNKAQKIVATNLGTTANLTMAELTAIKKSFPEFFTGLPTANGGTSSAVAAGAAAGLTQIPRASPVGAFAGAHPTTTTTHTSVTHITGPITVKANTPTDLVKGIKDTQRANKLKGLVGKIG